MRRIALTVAITLGAAVASRAQQPGPVAPVPDASRDEAKARLFPLWKSLLGERKFMPPYGLNLVFFDLSGRWDIESFSASVEGQELASLSGSASVHPFTYGVRADVWVLPFLNVFVTAGGVDLDVQAVGEDIVLGTSGIPPEPVRGDLYLDLDFTGSYGGGGLVLSGAWRKLFASVDGSVVWTHLESQETGVTGNELETYTGSFRVGYIAGPIQPYVGGRYVRKINYFEGTVAGPGGRPVTFGVELQAPKWNYQIGVHAIVAKHFEIVVEAGYGKRTHGLVNVGYRF